MMFPLENVTSSPEVILLLAVVVGFGFGFVLERAGFGVSTKLAAQFYGTDMTVFKVMFTAIVVASLGLVLVDAVGLVELESLAMGAASYTFLWPMLVGGLMLGAGFVIAGYCPGTSVVAAASGNVDGLMTFGGVIVGSVLFGELYPSLEAFHHSGNLGHLFLSDVLGVSREVVVAGVTVLAIGAFVGAEKVELLLAKRATTKGAEAVADATPAMAPARGRRVRRMVFVGLAAFAALSMTSLLVEEPALAEAEAPQATPIDVDALAQRLTSEPWSVRVLDLRSEEAFAEARVPHSEWVPSEGLSELGLEFSEDTRDVVLVAAEGLEALPLGTAGYPGRVLALEGGFASWHAFMEETPAAPNPMDSEAVAAFTYQSLLSEFLTGQAAPPPPRPAVSARPRPSGGGGGGCD